MLRKLLAVSIAHAIGFLLPVLLTASVAAQEYTWGSRNPSSRPLVGSHWMIVPGHPGPFGTIQFSGDERAAGAVLSVQASPWGGGEAVRAGAGWTANFAAGISTTLTFNATAGRHDFQVQESNLSGYLLPMSAGSGSGSADATDPEGFEFLHFREFGGEITIACMWPVAWNEFIWKVEFVQIVTLKVEAVRRLPSGQEIYEALPPGTKARITGNGGLWGTGEERAAGAGQMLVDGSTYYVDSGKPGWPGYVHGGGAGWRDNQGAGMVDKPYIPPAAVAEALATLPNPMQIVGVRASMDATVYLFVNDLLVHRCAWTWQQTVDLEGAVCQTWEPPVVVQPNVVDPKHAQTLGKYLNFDYSGVAK
ncbi:MAG: hypothetical protein JNL08_07375 [Planctomycetes bacterium]|nr:hypothetical protein [Planctomycetota bacterium]